MAGESLTRRNQTPVTISTSRQTAANYVGGNVGIYVGVATAGNIIVNRRDTRELSATDHELRLAAGLNFIEGDIAVVYYPGSGAVVLSPADTVYPVR